MFSHVMIGVNDIKQAKKFYDAIMGVLGCSEGKIDKKGRCFYLDDKVFLGLTKPINGEAASCGNGMTIGFKVNSYELVDAWHHAGISHGGVSCEEPPGIRASSATRQVYLAFLRDPDGNKLCAKHDMSLSVS